ncbi:MAG: NAD(P)H-hydrate dehydratase [Tissierellia bacterium]|nr:NAD(P)H-hydrate dehydratase [Tissierellia bacterium]
MRINNIKVKKWVRVALNRHISCSKDDMGRVDIISDLDSMPGALYFCMHGAYRCGSGVVYGHCSKEVAKTINALLPEAVMIPIEDIKEYEIHDALAWGPGLNPYFWDQDRIRNILNLPISKVIDATGIRLLSNHLSLLSDNRFPLILTPHEGEFRALIKEPGNNRKDRCKQAIIFAKKYNVVLVLKGHRTFVTDGENYYINSNGNPGMATAASGDILTGIIVSLLGRKISSFKAACIGVYLHGRAGDLAKANLGETAIMARDILSHLATKI